MSSKKVILEKTEYDDMENELIDLKTIVASRHVVTIVEENLNWRLTWASASGTRIKYIVQDEQEAVKSLSFQLDHVQQMLEKMEFERNTAQRQCGVLSDEITRLKKQTWYEKLFSKK